MFRTGIIESIKKSFKSQILYAKFCTRPTARPELRHFNGNFNITDHFKTKSSFIGVNSMHALKMFILMISSVQMENSKFSSDRFVVMFYKNKN